MRSVSHDMGREDDDGAAVPDPNVVELAEAFASALLAGDEVMAELTIRDAMDANLSTAEIDERVIAPGLWLVGELWERDKLSIADEHIATEITLRVLALQREAQRVTSSRGGHTVMLAAPPGELHVVALRMVGNLLRGAGYDVVMLGPDVPADTLGAAARRHKADVVCLSSTMPVRTGNVLRAIDDVRRQWPSAGFIVGGRGLTVEGDLRSGVHVCGRVSDAVDAVDAMVRHAGSN
jgi:methanogenic corrinoid protein MtbC1